jgi:hypothetical protein
MNQTRIFVTVNKAGSKAGARAIRGAAGGILKYGAAMNWSLGYEQHLLPGIKGEIVTVVVYHTANEVHESALSAALYAAAAEYEGNPDGEIRMYNDALVGEWHTGSQGWSEDPEGWRDITYHPRSDKLQYEIRGSDLGPEPRRARPEHSWSDEAKCGWRFEDGSFRERSLNDGLQFRLVD